MDISKRAETLIVAESLLLFAAAAAAGEDVGVPVYPVAEEVDVEVIGPPSKVMTSTRR
jgi:hypothetical protein